MATVDLDDAPRKIKDLYHKGMAALERGNLDYAIDMYMTVLELEPRLLVARKFLRAAQLKRNNEKKASLSSLKGMGASMSAKGVIKKDPEKAVILSEKLLSIDPANKSFIDIFVQACEAADYSEEAIQTLEIANETIPNDIELLNKLGRLYLINSQADKARDCYEKVMALDPNDQVAIKNMKDAAALDTVHSGGWQSDGGYRDIIKNTEEAEALEQETRVNQSTSDLDKLIADTLAKAEREPENINFQQALGDLYNKNEQFEESLEAYEKANQLSGGADPQIERAINEVNIRIYDYNIEVLNESGDTAGAEEMEAQKEQFLLDDAADRVNRYPNDLQFKYEYGEVLYRHDMLNEAIQQFQAAQRNPQRRLEALYFLGLCFKEKGQMDIAVEQFEKAASEISTMDSTKMDLYYELGTISETIGNIDKALEYYKAIYGVDIGYKDVTEKIDHAYALKKQQASEG